MARDIDDLIGGLDDNLQNLNQLKGASEGNSLGYASNLNKKSAQDLLSNAQFINDGMEYYRQRDGITFSTTDEFIDHFMEDRTWSNVNTVSIAKDLYNSQTDSDAQNVRLARLQAVFDALPNFYEEGGRGWAGLGQNLVAGALDPTNLIPGAKAATVASRSAALLAKQGSQKAVSGGFKSGVKKGLAYEAGIGAGVEVVADTMTQNRDVELGLRDETSLLQTGIAAVTGGVLQGTLSAPGIIGAAGMGAKSGAIRGAKEASEEASRAAIDIADSDLPELDLDSEAVVLGEYERMGGEVEARRLAELEDQEVTPEEITGVDAKAPVSEGIEMQRHVQLVRSARATIDRLRADAEKMSAEGKLPEATALNASAARLETATNSMSAKIRNVVSSKTNGNKGAEVETLSREADTVSELLGLPKPEDATQSPVLPDQGGRMVPGARTQAENIDELGDGEVSPARTSATQKELTGTDESLNTSDVTDRTVIGDSTDFSDVRQSEAEVAQAEEAYPEIKEARANVEKQEQALSRSKLRVQRADEELAARTQRLADFDARHTAEQVQADEGLQKKRQDLQEFVEAGEKEVEVARNESANQEVLTATERNKYDRQTAVAIDNLREQNVEAEISPEPDVSEPVLDAEADMTPSQVIDQIATEVRSQNDVIKYLADYGYDPKIVQRELNQIGDARNPKNKAKRQEYFKERLEAGIANEFLIEVYDEVGMPSQGHSDIIRILIEERVPADFREKALEQHELNVNAQAMDVFAKTIQDLDTVELPILLEQIKLRHGQEMHDAVAAQVSSPQPPARQGAQNDKLTKFAESLLKRLPEDQAGRIYDMARTEKFRLNDQNFPPHVVNTVVDRIVSKEAEEVLSRIEGNVAGRDFSVSEDYGDNAPHMLRAIHKGDGTITVFGKEIQGGSVSGKLQKFVGRDRSRLFRAAKVDNGDGTKTWLTSIETSLREMEDAYIAAGTNRMVKDSEKEAILIELYDARVEAGENPDPRQDPRQLGQAIKDANSRIRNYLKIEDDKSYVDYLFIDQEADGTWTITDPQDLSEGQLDEAQASVREANKIQAREDNEQAKFKDLVDRSNKLLRDPVKREEYPDYEDFIKEVKSRLTAQRTDLVSSTDLEARARDIEKRRNNRLLEYVNEVRASIIQLRSAESKHAAGDITTARRDELQQAQYDRTRKVFDQLYKELRTIKDPDMKRKSQALIAKLKNDMLINEALVEHAKKTPPKPKTKTENVIGEEVTPTERDQAVQKANEVVRNTQTKIDQDALNDIIERRNNGEISSEEFTQEVRDLAQATEKLKKDAPVAPKPDGVEYQPVVSIKDGYEVDVPNAIQMRPGTNGSQDIMFGDEVLGRLRTNEDGSFTYQRISGASGDPLEDVYQFAQLPAMWNGIHGMHRGVFKAAGDRGEFAPSKGSAEDEYFTLDPDNTNTYKGMDESSPVVEEMNTSEAVATDSPVKRGPSKPVEDLEKFSDDFAPGEGFVTAVQITDPSNRFRGSVRVFATKPTRKYPSEKGQTLGQVLGAAKKGDYVVGKVPIGTKAVDLQDAFIPMDPTQPIYHRGESSPRVTDRVSDDAVQRVQARKALEGPQLVTLQKLERQGLTDQDKNSSFAKFAMMRFMSKGIKMENAYDVQQALTRMHNQLNWNDIDSLESYQGVVNALAEGHDILARYAPDGIKLPRTTAYRSLQTLRKTIESYGSEDRRIMEEMLNRVTFGREASMPLFGTVPEGTVDRGQYQPAFIQDGTYKGKAARVNGRDSNKVLLNKDPSNTKTSPPAETMAHELGHWLYENALSPKDKMEFWRDVVGKYVTSEGVDMARLQVKLPGIAPNELANPQEFFANQFSMWMTAKGAVGDESYWAKISKYAKAIFDRIMKPGEKQITIDPDLAKLFERALPEREVDPITGAREGIVGRFDKLPSIVETIKQAGRVDDATGSLLGKISEDLIALDDIAARIDTALAYSTGNSIDRTAFIEAINKISRDVYGKYGGKAQAKTHRKIRGKEESGYNRDYYLESTEDGMRAMNKIKAAQKRLFEFDNNLRQLDDKGIDKLRGIMSSQIDEVNAEAELLGMETMRVDASSFGRADIDQASYDHLVMLVSDLRVAVDQVVRESVDKFNKKMPFTTGGARFRINSEGNARVSKPSPISLLNKARNTKLKKHYEKLQEDIDLIDQLTEVALARNPNSVFFDESAAGDPDIVVSPKDMTDAQISNEAKSTPDEVKRMVDLQNEAKDRANTSVNEVPVESEMSETMQRLLDQVVDQESGEQIMSLALSNTTGADQKRIINAIRGKMDSLGLIPSKPITDGVTSKAIKKEVEDQGTIEAPNGVDGGVSPALKAQLFSVTSGNKRQEYIMRQVVQRALRLTDRPEEQQFISQLDLQVISGMAPEDLADEAVEQAMAMPATTDQIGEIRGVLRKIAAGLDGSDTGMRRSAFGAVGRIVYAISPDETKRMFRKFLERMAETEDLLEEEVADFAVEMISNGTITNLAESNLMQFGSPVQIRKLHDDFAQRVAYVIRGATDLSDDAIPASVSQYGDVFAHRTNSKKVTASARTANWPHVSKDLAPEFIEEELSSLTPAREQAVRNFVGAGPLENLDDYVYVARADGSATGVDGDTTFAIQSDKGYGVHLQRPKALSKEALTPEEKLASIMEGVSSDSPNYTEINDIASDAVRFGEAVRNARINGLSADSIRVFAQMEAGSYRTLSQLGVAVDPPVVTPVVARTNNLMNFGEEVFSIDSGRPDQIDGLFLQLVDEMKLSPKTVADLKAELAVTSDGVPVGFTGSQLFEALTSANSSVVRNGDYLNKESAVEALNSALQKAGFDGAVHEDVTIVFSGNSVHHLSDGWKKSDARSTSKPVSQHSSVGTSIADYMEFTGEPLSRDSAPMVVSQAVAAGAPDEMVRPLRRMVEGRALAANDIDRATKSSTFINAFSENSIALRNMGAKWLANIIKPLDGVGIFERHDVDLNRIVHPISAQLRALPDSPGALKRWMQRNSGLIPQATQMEGGIGYTLTARRARQPESHDRIISALRLGKEAVMNLSPQERRIALDIANAFDKELSRMREAGIQVGDVRQNGSDFYVPQMWDVEAIRENPEGFRKLLAQYFVREQSTPGFDGVAKDRKAIDKMSEDIVRRFLDSDGLVDESLMHNAVTNPFYRRMIRLTPDMPEAVELQQFMENDLEGIITKYFDKTVRKRALSDKFGVDGHGFAAYVDTANGGAEAAANILASDKTRMVDTGLRSEEQTFIKPDAYIPALREDPLLIEQIVNEAFDVLKDGGDSSLTKMRAKNIILNAYPPQQRDNKQLLARIDGIINGAADFPDAPPTRQANKNMTEMMRVLNKRPKDGTTGQEWQHTASRSLRTFNSVSLLGATTLTSLPDLVLPIVRSGNFRAFIKSLTSYMGDPEYRRFAKSIGTGIENLVHDRMVQMGGEGNQRFSNSFFNFTGLTTWTNTMREISSMVGYEAFKMEVNRAMRLRAEGNVDSNAYKYAVNFLSRYGLTGENADYDFLALSAKSIDSLKDSDEIAGNALRYGMLRFTNEAVFTPNPNDVPLWAQGPIGQVIFQLKSFPLMMSRMAFSRGGVMDNFNKWVRREGGSPMPALYLATAGAGMGASANYLKDIIQSRGEDDEGNPVSGSRERRITELLKFTESMGLVEKDGDYDEALGHYFEGLLAMGGLGLFAELLYNTAQQADNGMYGTMRIMSSIAGPSFGAAVDAVQTGQGLNDFVFREEDAPTGKAREAFRKLATRVPVLGSSRAFREAAADIGGEPTSASRGSGASFSSQGNGFSNFGEL